MDGHADLRRKLGIALIGGAVGWVLGIPFYVAGTTGTVQMLGSVMAGALVVSWLDSRISRRKP
jgi:hypothetical protein